MVCDVSGYLFLIYLYTSMLFNFFMSIFIYLLYLMVFAIFDMITCKLIVGNCRQICHLLAGSKAVDMIWRRMDRTGRDG